MALMPEKKLDDLELAKMLRAAADELEKKVAATPPPTRPSLDEQERNLRDLSMALREGSSQRRDVLAAADTLKYVREELVPWLSEMGRGAEGQISDHERDRANAHLRALGVTP